MEGGGLLRSWSLVLLLALAGCDPARPGSDPAGLKGTLRLDGSTSVYPLMRTVADVFTRAHPGVRLELKQSSTGEGLRALLDGRVEIANATRAPTEEEAALARTKNRALHLTVVAHDAVAILVHASNPVADITVRDLQEIFFAGSMRDWSEVPGYGVGSAPLHVHHLSAADSGTADLFRRVVLWNQSPAYAPGSEQLSRTPDVAKHVREDRLAIAYSPVKWVGPGVKVLTVEGVGPSEMACLDGTYPLCRRLTVVTDGPPRGLARELISFVLGTTSQHSLVRAQGYFPIF